MQEAYSGVPKKSKHEKAKRSSSATLDPFKIFYKLRGDLCPVLDLKDPPLIFGEDIFLRLKVDKSVTKEVFVVRTELNHQCQTVFVNYLCPPLKKGRILFCTCQSVSHSGNVCSISVDFFA